MIEITFDREKSNGSDVYYKITDGSDALGQAFAVIENDIINFKEINAPPFFYDGLTRAVLNYAVLNGINKCCFTIADLSSLENLGIIKKGEFILDDIQAFFASKKCL